MRISDWSSDVCSSDLSIAKILENMEIGHNVMHGQWDWMRDPKIHSTTWEWDNASTAEGWKHSHNQVHHTYTNIVGKDNDLGYGIMRVDEDQKWYRSEERRVGQESDRPGRSRRSPVH